MKKEEIQPWDLQRILLGEVPGEFLLEVFLRTVFIYLLLMVALRLMGKRMDGQLTLAEMAVMVMLGAIVSVPMQIPDRGVLLGIVALLCVVFQRSLNWFGVKNERIEKTMQGAMSILVKDGILQLDEMRRSGISKQHLFATLRKKGILNLGKIKRVYFEACGLMNVYERADNNPGLPVLPSDEMDLVKSQTRMDHTHVACTNCGNVGNSNDSNCRICGEHKWMTAVVNAI